MIIVNIKGSSLSPPFEISGYGPEYTGVSLICIQLCRWCLLAYIV